MVLRLGSSSWFFPFPTACAVGCILPPLRGCSLTDGIDPGIFAGIYDEFWRPDTRYAADIVESHPSLCTGEVAPNVCTKGEIHGGSRRVKVCKTCTVVLTRHAGAVDAIRARFCHSNCSGLAYVLRCTAELIGSPEAWAGCLRPSTTLRAGSWRGRWRYPSSYLPDSSDANRAYNVYV